MVEPDLSDEVAAFLKARAALKAEHGSQWVVFCRGAFQGVFPKFSDAASNAVTKFGDTPFLIRQITAEDERVPLVFVDPE
ncbi:MAG: hypothetical protein NW203_15060 [Hyphomonadaceae bacterium]|nr:hypothetical protein [Hyphomonadaceae bacterium]